MHYMRNIIYLALIVLFGWFVFEHISQVHNVLVVLSQAQFQWLIIAAALQIIYYLVYTRLYQYTFKAVTIARTVEHLIPLVLGALALNVIAPSANTAGAALFIDDAKVDGHSGIRAGIAVIMAILIDILSFLLVLMGAFVFLAFAGDLNSYIVIATITLLTILLLLILVMNLGWRNPRILKRMLKFVQKVVHGFSKSFRSKAVLSNDFIDHVITEIAQIDTIVTKKARLTEDAFAVALLSHAIHLAVLYTIFLAFGAYPSFGIVLAGYSAGVLFLIISPTPQGIGVVEGAMGLMFSSLGVPAGEATVIPIIYRVATFWIPLVIGFVLLRRTKTFVPQEAT